MSWSILCRNYCCSSVTEALFTTPSIFLRNIGTLLVARGLCSRDELNGMPSNPDTNLRSHVVYEKAVEIRERALRARHCWRQVRNETDDIPPHFWRVQGVFSHHTART